MKVSEVIKLLKDDGWKVIVSEGNCRQFKHPIKMGRITVSGKLSSDLAPETVDSILKQSGLRD